MILCKRWLLIGMVALLVSGCGSLLCGRESFKTGNGVWEMDILSVLEREIALGGNGDYLTLADRRQLPVGHPMRIPLVFADKVTVTVERGPKLEILKRGEVSRDVLFEVLERADRAELYDGRLTLEYERDGHHVKEVYRITKALINASQPDSCAE